MTKNQALDCVWTLSQSLSNEAYENDKAYEEDIKRLQNCLNWIS